MQMDVEMVDKLFGAVEFGYGSRTDPAQLA
jgi:hypothetical protein